MKKLLLATSLLATLGAASAHETTYNITTTWFEPQTQPKDTIFQGSFTYDEHSHTVTGLKGLLSESMTGMNPAGMVWLTLDYQLASWYDASLGGTFAAVFKNSSTTTFWGGGWTPQDGLDAGSVYANFPVKPANPGNAYALIFVPNDPAAALTSAQISHLAYADCAPTAPGGMMQGGGMMGAVCMTGIGEAVYGTVGTMDGYPVSQSITAAVPEPGTWALLLAGAGLLGVKLRRSRA